MNRFIGGALLVAVTTWSPLVAGTSVSASASTHAADATAPVSTQARPPKIKQVRYTCHPEGAVVSVKLRNPNRMQLSWQVRLFNDDVAQAQAVTLAARTDERVRFHAVPDGESSLQVLDDLGETVAVAEVVVECTPAIDRTGQTPRPVIER